MSFQKKSSDRIDNAFYRHCDENPNKVFCYFYKREQVREITYDDLRREVERFGHILTRANVKNDDFIGIMLPYSTDLYSSFIGAIVIGAVPSFFPQPSDKQDKEHYWSSHLTVLARANIKCVVVNQQFANSITRIIPDHGLKLLIVEESVLSSGEIDDLPKLDVTKEKIAFLQHSSGSTDVKKGVALSHRAVIEHVNLYAEFIKMNEDSVIVSWLPLYHDMGLITCFLLPLLTGVPVVSIDPFEWVARPSKMLSLIERYKATHVWLPNFAFHHLIETHNNEDTWDLSSLSFVNNCSEPCKVETFDIFYQTYKHLGLKETALSVCYAMAETVFAVTQTEEHQKTKHMQKNGTAWLSCGKPLPGVEIIICNKTRESLCEGEVGEIAIKCSYLFNGYHNLPEKSSEQFHDGWYFSGDLGFLNNNELFVVGRIDDVMNIKGRKYFAHDVEFSANKAFNVKKGRLVSFSIFDKKVGSQEPILIVEKKSPNIDERQLSKEIKSIVEQETGMLISQVKFVDSGWLVKTTSGKFNRQLNQEKYLIEKNK